MELFCERCGCTDPIYFVPIKDKMQCRRCIAYQGKEGTALVYDGDVGEELPFELTDAQNSVSEKIREASRSQDVLVYAVCGAGKTELVLKTISERLSLGQRVGVAVARRQVVLQLSSRYQALYPHLKVTPVCEGHTEVLDGHLIVATTHQLFRFPKTFDLLILDEPDAFPFSQDPVLQGFARQAVKGRTVYLTATPDPALRQLVKSGQLAMVTLNRRPHHHDLPVPAIRILPMRLQAYALKQRFRKETRPYLIFVPSLRQGEWLSRFLDLSFAHAQAKDLDLTIREFKEGKKPALITTTVLERGVTFENVQIAVLGADHPVYNLASLIQIAGRAGRSPKFPSGEVVFYCASLSQPVVQCLNLIHGANRAA